jgi:hypothetical protein
MITGHLRGPIAGGAAGTLALQVFQTGCRFAISLALARMLGASGYGAYSFAIACVGVLSVLARLDNYTAFCSAHFSRLCLPQSRWRLPRRV